MISTRECWVPSLPNTPRLIQWHLLKRPCLNTHRGNAINSHSKRTLDGVLLCNFIQSRTGSCFEHNKVYRKPEMMSLYKREERHHALGCDTTSSWSRALTHTPRCNRTRHRVIWKRNVAGVMPLVRWRPSWIRCPYLDLNFVTAFTLK